MILINAPEWVHPSTMADSSNSFGIELKYPVSIQQLNGIEYVEYATINEIYESKIPNFIKMMYSGISNNTTGNILRVKKSSIVKLLPLNLNRETLYAAVVAIISEKNEEPIATAKLFLM